MMYRYRLYYLPSCIHVHVQYYSFVAGDLMSCSVTKMRERCYSLNCIVNPVLSARGGCCAGHPGGYYGMLYIWVDVVLCIWVAVVLQHKATTSWVDRKTPASYTPTSPTFPAESPTRKVIHVLYRHARRHRRHALPVRWFSGADNYTACICSYVHRRITSRFRSSQMTSYSTLLFSVIKFKRRARYLEFFVQCAEKALTEGIAPTALEWCVDTEQWLFK